MSALGSLVVNLALEHAEFKGGLDKSEQAAMQAAKRIQDTMDGMQRKIAATAGAVAGGLAAAFSIAAFKNLISGAMETGAALDDLSQQTGATVEALSGLNEIGRINGTGIEKIGSAMNKLSGTLAGSTEESKGAAKAIQALGLDYDKFRQMRPEDQMQAVAKAMSQFEDGADKSAVAMALYGKQGAELLPFLNDLADAGGLQSRVTAEQAAAAANLGDNLTRLRVSGNAWGEELANGMIPALDLGTQALLDVMNGTGGLREEIRKLSEDGTIAAWTTKTITGVTYVMDAFSGFGRAVISVGEIIGAWAAMVTGQFSATFSAIGQAVSGNFGGAMDTMKTMLTNQKNTLGELGAKLSDTWSEETLGQKLRARMVDMKDMGDTSEATKPKLDFKNVIEKTTKAAQAAKPPLDALLDTITKQTTAFQLATAQGDQLSQGQKLELTVREQVRSGKVKLTQTDAALLESGLKLMLQAEQTLLLQQEEVKATEAARAERLKSAQSAEQTAAKLDEGNRALHDEIELMGLSEVAQANIRQQRNEVLILTKEATLAELERQSAITGTQTRVEIALAAEIEGLKERNRLLGREAAAKATGELTKANKAAAEESGKFWTDALMRGFESGKGFFDNMWDTIRNKLKTDVLKVFIQPIAAGITGMLGMGSASAADSVATASSAINGASMLGTASSWLTNFGQASADLGVKIGGKLIDMGAEKIGTAIMDASTSATAASTMQMAGDVMGYLNAAMLANQGKWGAAIGAGIGTYFGGPIGSFIGQTVGGWVDDAFGGGKEYTTGTGLQGRFSDNAFSGSNYQSWKNDGSKGFFGIGASGSSSGTNYSAIDPAAQKSLSDAFLAINVQTAGYAAALGENAAAVGRFSKDISIAFGADAEANKAAIVATLKDLANDAAKAVIGTAYSKEGEATSDTLARLAVSLTAVNGAFKDLGNELAAVSAGSANVASKLIDAFGGLDKYAQGISSYFQNYYSQEERNTATRNNISTTLAGAGLTSALPTDRAGYRALVDDAARLESIDTEAGRKLYATLVSLSDAFASITPAATAATANVEKISAAMQSLDKDTAALQIELLAAQGKTQGAAAALKVLETQGFSGAELAAYDLNAGLRATISTLNAAAEAANNATASQSSLAAKYASPLTVQSASALLPDGLANALLAQGSAQIRDTIAGYIKSLDPLTEAGRAAITQVDGLSGALDVLVGEVDRIAAQDAAATLRAAADAQSTYTRAVETATQRLTAAQAAVASANNAVDAVRAEGTNAYLSALQAVATAQDRVTSVQLDAQASIAREANAAAAAMRGLGASLREFIDGAALPPTAQFGKLLTAALGGDKAAMQALPGAATGAIDEAKLTASNFSLEKARILAQVSAVATAAEFAGRNTIAEPTAMDTLAKAQQDLAAAQATLAQSLAVANTIDAPLAASVTDLVAKFANAQAESAKALQDLAAAQQTLAAIQSNTLATAGSTSTSLGKLDSVVAATATVTTAVGAMQSVIGTLLDRNFDAIDTSLNGLLDYTEFASGLNGLATDSQLRALFNEIDTNGDGQINKLEAIRLATEATKTATEATARSTASFATGASSVVSFAANDPIRSVFANIGKTNDLLIDSQQLFLTQLLGVGIGEDLQALGAQNSAFEGTYSLQAKMLAQLQSIASYAYYLPGIATESYNTNVNWHNGVRVRFDRGTATGGPGGAVFAQGGAFTNSIVSRPTSFNMGLMGEAGPEAIMPLANINGSLGVRFAGNNSNDALVGEIRRLRESNERLEKRLANIEAATYSSATSNALTADSTRSMDKNGVLVYTDPAEPIKTEVVAA